MSGRRRISLALAVIFIAFCIWWLFCLPANLFEKPLSTIILDRNGQLIGAKIANDGQWRFPETDSVPTKFATCITTYEDRGFYDHLGISPSAMLRAAWQNVNRGSVVSGASTITMQVMRMSRSPKPRSIWQKLIEMSWASRAEWSYSKSEILNLYASNAPFGGNVVGLDAAAWRYFNKPSYALSWAESAVLAVLPNAPGMIYPGRNPDELLRKRNGLLEVLRDNKIISEEDYSLALLEDLPSTPLPLPENARHLLVTTAKNQNGSRIESTINSRLQNDATDILNRRLEDLRRNHIQNGAILIADTETGEILAYIGNGKPFEENDGSANDMIMTPRSSGSILKPFLFGAMIEQGDLTPRQLIPDIPTQYSGFSPKNYDESYSGAVPAEEALARSLNIPAVRMLRDFGIPNFHKTLNETGFTTITKSPDHYGLSLILGGAEVTLWDLVNAYRMLANTINRYPSRPAFVSIGYSQNEEDTLPKFSLNAGASYATAEAMALVTRPDERASWEVFGGSEKIAWKTGTSYGFRDAWAVGLTAKFTVGVWVGNASGEGRPGITGLNAAAPIMFDIFNILSDVQWFMQPTDEYSTVAICARSGMRSSNICAEVRNVPIPKTSLETAACTHCEWIHLDENEEFRVNTDCYPQSKITTKSWFLLSPLESWYYQRYNADYKRLPDWMPTCNPQKSGNVMRMIYPREESSVFIPRELSGEKEKIILKAAHTRPNSVIYWHLNDEYIGLTSGFHQMEIQVPSGNYRLLMVDEMGETLTTNINVETK